MKAPKFFRWIVERLRNIVRTEVEHSLLRRSEQTSKDIRLALQRRAVDSTAEYVERHMHTTPAFETPWSLMVAAIAKASLTNSRLAMEFGVFKGKSINFIADKIDSTIYGFDSFEGLPETWRTDFEKGHFSIPELPLVKNNVVLIKGWFQDTLPGFLQEHAENVGFLHIDCDLYSSTAAIFKYLEKRLVPGTVIVFDEYFNYPGWQKGEFLAFREFLEKSALCYEYLGYNYLHEQVAVVLKSRT